MKQENEYKKLTCTNKKINDQAVVKKKRKRTGCCVESSTKAKILVPNSNSKMQNKRSNKDIEGYRN